MRRKAFKANPELCVGCRLRELMCSLVKAGCFNPHLARIKVVLNEAECIGCLACVEACPFGAIRVGPNQEILKCDLCDGDSVCVKHCYKIPAHSSPCLPYLEWRALDRALKYVNYGKGAQ